MASELEPFTVTDAELVVQRVLNYRYTAREVSSSHFKDGLVATHEKLTIPAVDKVTRAVIMNVRLHAKVMPKERAGISDFSIGESVFWKEMNFYELISHDLFFKYKDHKFMVNCYSSKGSRMVFEDLVGQNYVKCDIFDDSNLFKVAVVSLARFHCTSIVAEAMLSWKINSQVTMKSKYNTSFDEMMFNNDWSTIAKWYRVGIELTCILCEQLFDHDVEELRAALLHADDLVKTSDTHRNVICHGDLRKENMMFLAKQGEEIKCLFMNFYLIRYAPLALDVLQLLYLHTSKEFRDQHEEEIIGIYQSKLTDTVNQYENLPTNLDINLPSLEDVQKALKDLKLFGPAVASVYISLSLMSAANAVAFIKKPVAAGEFLIQEVVDVCQHKLTSNERLKQQFGEVLTETLEIYGTIMQN